MSASMLSDGELAGPLADLSQVSAGEALGHLGHESKSTSLATGLFLRLDFRMAILEPSSGEGNVSADPDDQV